MSEDVFKTCPNCGVVWQTMDDFLSDRPLLAKRGEKPSRGCPDFCMRQGALDPCQMECECVWVREVMQVIKNRGKEPQKA